MSNTYNLKELQELEAAMEKFPHRWSQEERRLMSTAKSVINLAAVLVKNLETGLTTKDAELVAGLHRERFQVMERLKAVLDTRP